MEKETDLLQRQQPEIIDGFPTGNILIGVTSEELNQLETIVEEHDEIKALYNRWLGYDMSDYEFFTLLNDILVKIK